MLSDGLLVYESRVANGFPRVVDGERAMRQYKSSRRRMRGR